MYSVLIHIDKTKISINSNTLLSFNGNLSGSFVSALKRGGTINGDLSWVVVHITDDSSAMRSMGDKEKLLVY